MINSYNETLFVEMRFFEYLIDFVLDLLLVLGVFLLLLVLLVDLNTVPD